MYEKGDADEFQSNPVNKKKELNMTQRDMAKKLNVSDKTISKWETGVNFPDLKMLNQIARLIGVSVSDLLEADDLRAPNRGNDLDNTTITRFRIHQVVSFLLFIFAVIIILWGLQVAYWMIIIGLLMLASSFILFAFSMISFKSSYEHKKDVQSLDHLSNFYSLLFFESILLVLFLLFMSFFPANYMGQVILIAFQVSPMLIRKRILKSNNYETSNDKTDSALTRVYWSVVIIGNLLYGLLLTGWIQSDNRLFITTLMIATYLFLFGTPLLGFAIYQRKRYVRI